MRNGSPDFAARAAVEGAAANVGKRMRVLIVSPSPWGTLRLSKHHYAAEFARRGHDVVYLNPPERRLAVPFRLEEREGLRVVTFRPWCPARLRHAIPRLYAAVVRRQIRRMMSWIGTCFDVVWCFDSEFYPDLSWFGARLRVYHVVDQVTRPEHVRLGETADMVVAVSPSIATRLAACGVPPIVVPHGLATAFADEARARLHQDDYRPGAVLKAGYAGNLWSYQLDRDALRHAIDAHPDVQFHFWGPIEAQQSNVGGVVTEKARAFICYLREKANVRLRGVVSPAELAVALREMDALLICYDPALDRNRGANSHKLLEYLATGRVVIATQVLDYIDCPGLIEMLPDASTERYAELCGAAFAAIEVLNHPEQRARRRRHALQHTYEQHGERLELLFRHALDRGGYMATMASRHDVGSQAADTLPESMVSTTVD